jgi:hypothetical protein
LRLVQRDDDVVELLFLFAQFLGLLGVVPDRGSSSDALTVLRRSDFGIEVKDTSGDPASGPAGR